MGVYSAVSAGFDLGFDRAGMKCAWQVEYDEKARGVLARHWPEVDRYEDVKDVGRDNLRAVDVICGGFPCQDVSVAGKRAGLAGDRSGLWAEFKRIIGELTPTWVVIENVPGLLSSNEGRDMGVVLWQLAELGYGWAYRVLDSQFFGVAQRRRRVFIVGHLGTNGERAGAVLFESESLPWHPAPSREARQGTARDATSSLASGRSATGANVAAGVAQPLRSGRQYSDMGDGQTNVIPVVMATGQANSEITKDVETSLTGTNEQPIVFNVFGGNKRKDRPEGGFYVQETEQSKTLDGTGLSGEAAQGGTVVAVRLAQTSSNGWGVNEDGTTGTLDNTGGGAVAYGLLGETTPKVSREVMPTLRSGNSNSGEQHQFVAFAQNTRDEVRQVGGDGEIAGALGAQPGMKQQTYLATFDIQGITNKDNKSRVEDGLPANTLTNNRVGLAFHNSGYGAQVGEQASTLQASDARLSNQVSGVISRSGVRRLTPVECERLQSFPCQWTAEGVDGPQSDSARYKQLGNAVTVNVAEWIGRRIVEASA